MSLHIGAAAAAVASIRIDTARRTGCPEWDARGIARALEQTQGAPGDVLAAAALAASDPKLNAPSANGFTTHWPKNATATPRVSHNIPCPDHPEHDMPHDHGGDMTHEEIAAKAAEIRSTLPRPARLSVPTRVPTPGDAPRLDVRRAQIDQEPQR